MNATNYSLKLLWVIPKWTFPVTDGARVATDSLVKNTVLAGASVDVLCLSVHEEVVTPAEMKNNWKVNAVHIVKRHGTKTGIKRIIFVLKSLILKPFTPVTFSSFVSKDVKKKVFQIIQDGNYDFVVLDALHLAASVIGPDLKLPKIIYRAHNIESDLWLQSYKENKNPVLKMFFYFQYILVRKFEENTIKFVTSIAAISNEDKIEIDKVVSDKCRLVPLGMDSEGQLQQVEDLKTKFLFIGRLDWPPNKDGLEWILQKVWPNVIERRPDAVLKIVGSGTSEWLVPYKTLKGIEFVGFVKDLNDAYKDCHFTIVPIFYGSGTRIKVIESFAKGRRLISTKMGVQGADLDEGDYVRAESIEDWLETLSSIQLDVENKKKLTLAREKMASSFGAREIGKNFYDWLRTF